MDAINELKIQVINEFNDYLDKAAIGYEGNYEMILHKIAFIQSYQSFDKINFIYEFLKNN